MAKKQEVDLDRWNEIRQHGEDLKSSFAKRNENNNDFDDMYLMDWTEPTDTGMPLSKTISPDARNAIHGAVRLMVASDPLFNVPKDKSAKTQEDEKLEMAAAIMWQAAGRIKGVPVHYDALLSSLLYGEMHVAITDTEQMVEHAKQIKQSKAYVSRAEQIASRTPYVFDVWSPQDGYPEEDNYGLTAYLRSTKVKASEIRARFGANAYEQLVNKGSNDEVDLTIFYDLEYYAVAIDDVPVICTPHELVAIPVVCTLSDGSRLFTKPEHQRQPFLYTLLKSGMWKRQNLSLTTLYTLIESLILLPQIIHAPPRSNPDKPLTIDYSQMASTISIDKADGEDITIFDKSKIIDPNIQMGLSLAEEKVNESTMFKTALGQPLSSGTAFSTYSLLSQSGRIPLISVQRRAGWGIGEVVETALRLYKDSGHAHPALDLKPSEVPDTIMLEAKLDIALPQDKLQLANIASMLAGGDNPMTSREWVRENILNIGQSKMMDESIWNEKAANVQYQAWLQQQVQQAQMAMQQQMQQAMQPQQGMPAGAGMMPQGQPPMGQSPQSAPPMGMGQSPVPQGDMSNLLGMSNPMEGLNAGAMMPPGQADLAQGGLPPEMLGMLPGQGVEAMPPEVMRSIRNRQGGVLR